MRPGTMAVSVLLLIGMTACPPEEPYEEVGIHFNRLIRNPDQACAWVSAHAGTYDGKFASCATQQLGELTAYINKQIAWCDSVFLDPDLRNGCYSDHNVYSLEFRESSIAAVIEITVHGNGCASMGCNCVIFGQVYQAVADTFDQNARDLGLSMTWELLLDQALEGDRKDLACGG